MEVGGEFQQGHDLSIPWSQPPHCVLAFCWLSSTHDDEQGALIPNINDDEPDTALSALNLVKKGEMFGA